jgi:hypothetical protein
MLWQFRGEEVAATIRHSQTSQVDVCATPVRKWCRGYYLLRYLSQRRRSPLSRWRKLEPELLLLDDPRASRWKHEQSAPETSSKAKQGGRV